jgi:oxaloacetate decarboxylase gamma subunit
MQASLIDQGLILMLAGMGTVFVFLTVLVIAMTVMSMLIRRLQPVTLGPTEEEVAAISVAIARHRQR